LDIRGAPSLTFPVLGFCQAMEEDHDPMCAICFEEVGKSIALPCRCKVSYCMKCWDRALAQSFNSCGQALCPTCRGPVHVDFDSETGSLLFSKETEDLTYRREIEAAELVELTAESSTAAARAQESESNRISAARQRTVERLAEQAKPTQVRLLRQFGQSHPMLKTLAHDGPLETLKSVPLQELKSAIKDLGGNTDGCLEKKDLLDRLTQASGGRQHELASYWATRLPATPSCVCGGVLERVQAMQRVRRLYEKHHSVSVFDLLMATRLSSGNSGIICDLCDGSVSINTALWTCKSDNLTILHATSYDVCDSCFSQHVCGVSGLSNQQAPHSSSSSGSAT